MFLAAPPVHVWKLPTNLSILPAGPSSPLPEEQGEDFQPERSWLAHPKWQFMATYGGERWGVSEGVRTKGMPPITAHGQPSLTGSGVSVREQRYQGQMPRPRNPVSPLSSPPKPPNIPTLTVSWSLAVSTAPRVWETEPSQSFAKWVLNLAGNSDPLGSLVKSRHLHGWDPHKVESVVSSTGS